MKQSKKLFFLLRSHWPIFVIAFGLIIFPSFAHAGWLGDAILYGFGLLLKGIAYVIGLIGGIFISLGGLIIQYALELNTKILESPVVNAGFNISLSVANLGFVAVIMVIAIATILRIPSYEMKTTLWRLILAAFLVNFSLVIAGLFLDFSGVFTSFFLSSASGGNQSYANFAMNLAGSFSPQSLTIPGEPSAAATGVMAVVTGLVTPMFVAIFTVMLAIILCGTGILILIRYIYISLLLVIMPISWLLWVLPRFREEFAAWWTKFLNQVLFLPALSFFLYLTVVAGKQLGDAAKTVGSGTTSSSAIDPGVNAMMASAGPTFTNPSGTILEMIIMVALLVGGLMAAQKFGAVGAGVVMGAAKAAGMATGKFAGKIAMKPAGWVGGATSNALLKKGGLADRFSTTLAKIPGLGGASVGLSNLVASRAGAVEQKQKEFANVPKDNLIAMAKSRLPGGAATKAALANELAKKGALTKAVLGDRYEDLVKSADAMGATKDIYNFDPTAAVVNEPAVAKRENRPPRSKEEVIRAQTAKIPASATPNISPEALADPDVALALNVNQINQLSIKASAKQREVLNRVGKQSQGIASRDGLEKEVSELGKQLEGKLKGAPAWNEINTKLQAKQAELTSAGGNVTAEEKKRINDYKKFSDAYSRNPTIQGE